MSIIARMDFSVPAIQPYRNIELSKDISVLEVIQKFIKAIFLSLKEIICRKRYLSMTYISLTKTFVMNLMTNFNDIDCLRNQSFVIFVLFYLLRY